MTFEQTIGLITASVAIYGAALSSYVFVVQRLEKAKRVKVKISFGFLAFGSELSSNHLLLEAANNGHRTVTLSGWCIKTPKNEQIVMLGRNSEHAFPYEMADGKSVTCWLGVKEAATALADKGYEGIVKLKAEFRDSTGKRFRSDPLPFDITKALAESH